MAFRRQYYGSGPSKTYAPRAPISTYTADQVWGAAIAAQRINGEYLKDQEQIASTGLNASGVEETTCTPGREANKHLMRALLSGNGHILPEDILDGQSCRAHYQGLLFKELSGKLTSGFLKAVFQLSNKEEFASNSFVELAQCAAAPSGWQRDQIRARVEEKAADGAHFGKPGDKVEGEVEITQCNFSQQYGIYFNSGFFNGNHIFFANKEGLTVGQVYKIKGTVKAHRDNNTTQLNRVKVKQ